MTPGPVQLHAALRAQVQGLYACEAATDLLIAHASWLHRGDFVNGFVHTGPGLTSGVPMAAVNWPEAITALEEGRLPCSGGERRLLKIVASLAEGIPVDLRDTLTGVDAATISLVAAAVLHAGGHR
ncbi:hypothetical protein [Streptacidiphilus sp. EB129]|uniref:hypothetical protein n=1 Tax=Streptacidiphilus sp. EB129 TaxID=3156262 RepID=UPI0035183614